MTTVSSQTQMGAYVAYSNIQPTRTRNKCWTYTLDGHRIYVLSLGQEGDWAYDVTTSEWSQLQTQGFDGINLIHGTTWNSRVVGGDKFQTQLLELDPNTGLDNEFRPVEHIVTGGLPSRNRNCIGVSNFTATASVSDNTSLLFPISLAFSDDNGVTYSKEFNLTLTDISSQLLLWNSLGSYSSPGRIFRVTDYSGPVRIDGADCILTGDIPQNGAQ